MTAVATAVYEVPAGTWLPKALQMAGLAKSSSEAVRLLSGGAVFIDGERFTASRLIHAHDQVTALSAGEHTVRVGTKAPKEATIRVVEQTDLSADDLPRAPATPTGLPRARGNAHARTRTPDQPGDRFIVKRGELYQHPFGGFHATPRGRKVHDDREAAEKARDHYNLRRECKRCVGKARVVKLKPSAWQTQAETLAKVTSTLRDQRDAALAKLRAAEAVVEAARTFAHNYPWQGGPELVPLTQTLSAYDATAPAAPAAVEASTTERALAADLSAARVRIAELDALLDDAEGEVNDWKRKHHALRAGVQREAERLDGEVQDLRSQAIGCCGQRTDELLAMCGGCIDSWGRVDATEDAASSFRALLAPAPVEAPGGPACPKGTAGCVRSHRVSAVCGSEWLAVDGAAPSAVAGDAVPDLGGHVPECWAPGDGCADGCRCPNCVATPAAGPGDVDPAPDATREDYRKAYQQEVAHKVDAMNASARYMAARDAALARAEAAEARATQESANHGVTLLELAAAVRERDQARAERAALRAEVAALVAVLESFPPCPYRTTPPCISVRCIRCRWAAPLAALRARIDGGAK